MASDAPNKIEAFYYWFGELCKCGAAKRPKRWTCPACKEAQDEELGRQLDEACEKHIELGMRFAEDCFSRRRQCPTSSA